MKAQFKKYFPLTIMLLLLVLVVSLLPQEGAADKSLSMKNNLNQTIQHNAVMRQTAL